MSGSIATSLSNLPRRKEAKNYEDHLNIENLTLMQLEEKILINYLKSGDVEKLKDFLGSQSDTSRDDDAGFVGHELDQQKMEGLADM